MARKKSRITPPITSSSKATDFDDLVNGDAFLHSGCLCMKCENDEQEAINLDTGEMYLNMCGKDVVPVNVTIAWKKK